jgi:hypothetical protein
MDGTDRRIDGLDQYFILNGLMVGGLLVRSKSYKSFSPWI